MPLRALVLSADAKISGLLAQVLAELEVSAEVCADADMARQKLAGLVYAALVLDCDKESEVGNLLKEARKLAAGRKLAFVALVGGPGAPATAFRLGADFVLTKPIGVQQARNTLRTLKLVLEKMPVQATPETAQRATAAAAAAGGDSAPFRDLSISTPAAAPEKLIAPRSAPADEPARQAAEEKAQVEQFSEVPPPVALTKTKPGSATEKPAAAPPVAEKSEPSKPLVVVRSTAAPARQPEFKLMETYTDEKNGSSLVGKLLVLAVLLLGLVIVFRSYIPWQSLGPLASVAQTVGLYKPATEAPASVPEEQASTTPKPEAGTPESQPADGSADANQNAAAPAGDAATSNVVQVPEEEMEKLLARRVDPVIPEDQLPSGPVSPVVLQAMISKDGSVTDVKLAQGEAALAPYAMRAVRQWKYQPYVQDGQPVDVQTQITVTFGQQ